jgi:hypothetical protein
MEILKILHLVVEAAVEGAEPGVAHVRGGDDLRKCCQCHCRYLQITMTPNNQIARLSDHLGSRQKNLQYMYVQRDSWSQS